MNSVAMGGSSWCEPRRPCIAVEEVGEPSESITVGVSVGGTTDDEDGSTMIATSLRLCLQPA